MSTAVASETSNAVAANANAKADSEAEVEVKTISKEAFLIPAVPIAPYTVAEHLMMIFQNPDGQTMTPAFVNGLRRILYSEVACCSLGLLQNFISANTSEFNIDYLRHRWALVPFYLRGEDLVSFYPGEYCLRLCDTRDWSQPFRHHLTVAHPAGARTAAGAGAEAEAEAGAGEEAVPPRSPPPQPQQRGVGGVSVGLSLAIRLHEHCLLLRLKNAYRRTHHLHYDYITRQYALYSDAAQPVVLSNDQEWREAYEQVEEEIMLRLLPYNFYLCRLQPEQELCVTAVPSFGIGQQHAAFQSCCIAAYDFPTTPMQKTEESAQVSHHFPLARGGVSTYPLYINLILEANGHYDNHIAMFLALKTLEAKVDSLRQGIERILRNSASHLDEPISMVDSMGAPLYVHQKTQDLTPLFGKGQPEVIANNVVLKLGGETHTLGNLLHVYGLIILQELLTALAQKAGKGQKERQERYEHWLMLSLCSYKLPHPLQPVIEVHFKTPEDLPAGTQFADQYRRHRLPVQLLLMALDRIESLAVSVRERFMGIYPMLGELDLPKYRSAPIVPLQSAHGKEQRAVAAAERRGIVPEDVEDVEDEEGEPEENPALVDVLDGEGDGEIVADEVGEVEEQAEAVAAEEAEDVEAAADAEEPAGVTMTEFNEEFQ